MLLKFAVLPDVVRVMPVRMPRQARRSNPLKKFDLCSVRWHVYRRLHCNLCAESLASFACLDQDLFLVHVLK